MEKIFHILDYRGSDSKPSIKTLIRKEDQQLQELLKETTSVENHLCIYYKTELCNTNKSEIISLNQTTKPKQHQPGKKILPYELRLPKKISEIIAQIGR